MKYSHHPLPPNYIDVVARRKRFHLVIVGKDPFPTAPTGIPFCKPSWHEQNKRNGSGVFVLESIGVDVSAAMRAHTEPADLFCSLAAQGIIFLNCSYHFLATRGLPKKDYTYVDMALNVNEPIIRNAENVVLCGQSKILQEKLDTFDRFHKVVHPDPRNRRRAEWQDFWEKNKLQQHFDLHLRP